MYPGPGSGLDWCLVELGGDAVMLQLLVMCFSPGFWLCFGYAVFC